MNFDDRFQQVLNEFDFCKVRSVMKFLNWKWSGVGVPSIPQMIDTCNILFRDALLNYIETDELSAVSTGGFEVMVDSCEITIRFILEYSRKILP